jgi:hypothetical protein
MNTNPVLMALTTARDEVKAMKQNLATQQTQAVLASVTVLINKQPLFEFAVDRYELTNKAVADTCDSGHTFVRLPDHPTRDGRPRCPHCLAIGFDNFRKEIEERMKEDD